MSTDWFNLAVLAWHGATAGSCNCQACFSKHPLKRLLSGQPHHHDQFCDSQVAPTSPAPSIRFATLSCICFSFRSRRLLSGSAFAAVAPSTFRPVLSFSANPSAETWEPASSTSSCSRLQDQTCHPHKVLRPRETNQPGRPLALWEPSLSHSRLSIFVFPSSTTSSRCAVELHQILLWSRSLPRRPPNAIPSRQTASLETPAVFLRTVTANNLLRTSADICTPTQSSRPPATWSTRSSRPSWSPMCFS